MQETDFHFDEYLRSYSMPTIGMLKVDTVNPEIFART